MLQRFDYIDFNTSLCTCETYDDQQNEVDEVVEGMSIHHIVHDLHPALQSDHLRSRGKVTVSEQWPFPQEVSCC